MFIRRQMRLTSRLLCPINMKQSLLPIPIHELMREIATRYAAELQRYHVTLLDWQGQREAQAPAEKSVKTSASMVKTFKQGKTHSMERINNERGKSDVGNLESY